MSWLTPLGFLGLIGLIVLIIIYIIKPNYQQKFISSTFVWKLSLKYRKKKLPINHLQDILLFICQVLIITGMAAILAQPFIQEEKEETFSEQIAIIDVSASMMAETNGENRVQRAVFKVRQLAEEVLASGGRLTVILAGEKASYVVQSAGIEVQEYLYKTLDDLAEAPVEEICTYGEPDIEGAMKLAEQLTAEQSDVGVRLYTDTQYIDAGKVIVENVSDEMEWNAAILDVRALVHENYYRFEVDVACYGNVDRDVRVFFNIYGVNDAESTITLEAMARCKAGQIETLVFAKNDPDKPDDTITEQVEVFNYEYAVARVDEMDSFSDDNTFYRYGGKKPVLRVQYASAMPNNYFGTAMDVIRARFSSKWDVDYTEVPLDEECATEGFDVYIFEHVVPKTLPTDGLVILANPDNVPSNIGLRLGGMFSGPEGTMLTSGDEHPIMKGVLAENIMVTRFREISNHDGYTPLMYCYGRPVVMAKNEPDMKVLVMSFSLNFSDFAMLYEFPLFLTNAFNYFMPPTLTDHVYEVNSTVELDSRSEQLNVVGPMTDVTLKEFPGTVDVKLPGVYTITQTPISGEKVVENIFVRIPAVESNTAAVVDTLSNPYFFQQAEDEGLDLLFYFAMALVILLFMEWWLQTRKHF